MLVYCILCDGRCQLSGFLDKQLLVNLVCPQTGGVLVWRPEHSELWCVASGLAYPVRDGIPVMFIEKARALSGEELETLR